MSVEIETIDYSDEDEYLIDKYNVLIDKITNIKLLIMNENYDGAHHKDWLLNEILKEACFDETEYRFLSEGKEKGIAP